MNGIRLSQGFNGRDPWLSRFTASKGATVPAGRREHSASSSYRWLSRSSVVEFSAMFSLRAISYLLLVAFSEV